MAAMNGCRTGRCVPTCFLALLALTMVACGKQPEVAIQKAEEGDLLVRSGNTSVQLARAFRPGVPNALYKGAVKVTEADGSNKAVLHQVSAVCSMKGEPGWQTYDNLYGETISDAKQISETPSQTRWQILYHFDGRIEPSGPLGAPPWAARLKDNLCRRGDFDDRKAGIKAKS